MSSVLIFGRRREGKTTLALSLALATGKSVFIFDPRGEIYLPGAVISNEIVDIIDSLNDSKLVIYHPQDEVVEEFSFVAETLKHRHNFVLVLDEAHWIQKPMWVHEGLGDLIRTAPDDVDLIQTMHAPADSWGRGRSLATDWYMFRLTRPADLKAVAEQCGEEIAKVVGQLPKHHYMHYAVDDHTFQVNDKPESWLVSGGKHGMDERRRETNRDGGRVALQGA